MVDQLMCKSAPSQGNMKKKLLGGAAVQNASENVICTAGVTFVFVAVADCLVCHQWSPLTTGSRRITMVEVQRIRGAAECFVRANSPLQLRSDKKEVKHF